MEEEIEELDEPSLESEEISNPTKTSSPTSLPSWVTSKYRFSPSGSKKLPLEFDESDLQESFVRGSGPGGQAINKTNSNVQLIHIPTGIRIVCQETRSREQNRLIARRRMSRELEEFLRPGESVKSLKIEKERKKKRNKERKGRKRREEKRLERDKE